MSDPTGSEDLRLPDALRCPLRAHMDELHDLLENLSPHNLMLH